MSKLATLKLVKKKVKRFKKSKKKDTQLDRAGTQGFDKTSYHSTQMLRPRDVTGMELHLIKWIVLREVRSGEMRLRDIEVRVRNFRTQCRCCQIRHFF